jgi:hypothetical protein
MLRRLQSEGGGDSETTNWQVDVFCTGMHPGNIRGPTRSEEVFAHRLCVSGVLYAGKTDGGSGAGTSVRITADGS